MCLWYDIGQSITFLESNGASDYIFQAIFAKVTEIKEDFEVKRFMLGLTSFLINSDMPDSVKNNYGNIIKALSYLSQRSIEIRQKALQVKQKEDMADVEEEGERIICEDEDDTNIDLDSEEDEDEWGLDDDEVTGIDSMYDSPLDNIDEVLNLQN